MSAKMSLTDSGDETYCNNPKRLIQFKRKSCSDIWNFSLITSDCAQTTEVNSNSRGGPSKRGRKSINNDNNITIKAVKANSTPNVSRGRGRGNKQNTRKGKTKTVSKKNTTTLPTGITINASGLGSKKKNMPLVSLLNSPTVENTCMKTRSMIRKQDKGPGSPLNTVSNSDTPSTSIIALDTSIITLDNENYFGIPNSHERELLLRRGIDYSQPIHSIGNTAKYEDSMKGKAIFSSQLTNEIETISSKSYEIPEDTINLDDSFADDNEELTVKVEWKCVDTVKFTLRRHQTLKEIFKYFSHSENIGMDKLLFIYNDNILHIEDTPDSIGYSIAGVIEGGVVTDSIDIKISKLVKKPQTGIKIKFQCQKLRKPFETYIQSKHKLSVAMFKCAEYLEKSLKCLKFEFDGDVIKGTETAQDLDIEDEACIDVKILNVP